MQEETRRGSEEVPRGYWYLSFADGERPKGTQFLGAVILEDAPDTPIPDFAAGKEHDDLARVITMSHVLGLNPGGGVAAVYVEKEEAPACIVRYTNRLLSREDLAKMDDEAEAEA